MGLCNSPDIFQKHISEVFVGLDTVLVYINDLFHVTKISWTEHLTFPEDIFTRLQKAGLKVNSSKSCFGAHKFDYLDYHVTCDGVVPIPIKSRPSNPLQSQKTRKQLRQFIGMINFYCDMLKKRSEIISPLTALTSKNVKYNWKDEHQKCFDAIKRVIGLEVFDVFGG